MLFKINAICSLLIGIPALAGWIRYRRIQPVFYPFIWFITAGFINELLSIFFIYRYHNNFVNYNSYGLLSSLIVIYQLCFWRGPGQRSYLYTICGIFFIIQWLAEFAWHGTLFTFFSYAIIIQSFAIVFLSVLALGHRIIQPAVYVYKDPTCIICTGLIIYYIYAAIVELFWLYGLAQSPHFLSYVITILSAINLFTNLFYLLAIIWIPLKTRYLLQPLLSASALDVY